MISNFVGHDFLLILNELNHVAPSQEKRTKGWMTHPCITANKNQLTGFHFFSSALEVSRWKNRLDFSNSIKNDYIKQRPQSAERSCSTAPKYAPMCLAES